MRTGLAIALVMLGVAAPPAPAHARSCRYAQAAAASVPYVAHLRTDLVASAIGGESVCAFVQRAAQTVQREGYLPAPGPGSGGADPVAWTLHRRLVFPPGWPSPTGDVCDPHLHVTLWLSTQPGLAARAHADDGAEGWWIALNEYT